MSIGVNGLSAAGGVQVFTTSGRGHNAEELAEMALARIISVADTAPQPIRDQAIAFRESIRPVLVHALKQAAQSERVTIANLLRASGHAGAADIIHSI